MAKRKMKLRVYSVPRRNDRPDGKLEFAWFWYLDAGNGKTIAKATSFASRRTALRQAHAIADGNDNIELMVEE